MSIDRGSADVARASSRSTTRRRHRHRRGGDRDRRPTNGATTTTMRETVDAVDAVRNAREAKRLAEETRGRAPRETTRERGEREDGAGGGAAANAEARRKRRKILATLDEGRRANERGSANALENAKPVPGAGGAGSGRDARARGRGTEASARGGGGGGARRRTSADASGRGRKDASTRDGRGGAREGASREEAREEREEGARRGEAPGGSGDDESSDDDSDDDGFDEDESDDDSDDDESDEDDEESESESEYEDEYEDEDEELEGGSEDELDELRDAMDRDDPEAGLRALLRRLSNVAGGGMQAGFVRPGGSAKLKEILQGMKQMDDPSAQMAALSELNELLVISGEELMMSIPLDSFVPVLVEMMTMEYMPDIMLLAARALTTMADVIPPSRGAIVHHGALPLFCSRLLTIEYIDLAEQSLQALEKLSQDYGAECARQGALTACLSYLDFFSLGMQRVSLQIAANICRQLPSSTLDGAMDAVPILTNLLAHEDPRLVDSSCACLTNLATKMAKDSSERVVALCQSGLVAKVMDLISASSTRTVSPLTHHALIKLLNVCAKHNPDVALELLRGNLPATLSVALSRCKVLTTTSAGPSSASPASSGVASPIMTSDQLLEVATLADTLLPVVNSKSRSAKKEQSLCSQNVPVLTTQEPELLVNYATNLINVLMQAVDSSVPQSVKVKCLSALTKWTQLSSEQSFKTIVETTTLAAFCATQLCSREARQIEGCLDLVEFGMEKKTLDMARILRKEGAVHALKRLFEENERLANTMDAAAPAKSPAGDNTKTPAGLVPALGGGLRGVAARNAAMTSDGPEYRAALAHASRVYNKYFSASEQSEAENPSVERLRRASSSLRMTGDIASLTEFLDSVSGASTFELLESDSVGALKEYLAPRDWKDTKMLVDKYAAFIKAITCAKEPAAFENLIKRLSDALASCEDLSIAVTSIQPSSSRRGRDNSADDANLVGLVRPFKIRFKLAADSTDGLSNHSNNVMLVEPFATLSAIEDFLYPRVHKPGRRLEAPRRSSRLSPPADMEHDGDEEDDDEEGDEDEIMSDDEATLVGEDADEDGGQLDLTNEDIEQDDDEGDVEGGAPLHPPNSFAARAAAGASTRRLTFSVDGTILNPQTTVLQVVAFIARQSGVSMTELNWEKTNTITYQNAKATDVVPDTLQLGGVVDESKEELSKVNEAVAELGNSEMRATLGSFVPALCGSVTKALAHEEASDQLNDLLVVLTVLHELSVSSARILSKTEDAGSAVRRVSLPKESFIHGKLTGKLTRQLQDTVTLCSSSTPAWCTSLTRACPWLFPFESRYKLFKCVAFSLSRTLHHLHGAGSESGALTTDGGREIRVGRLQRLKVRVNREHIFASAKKVFNLPNVTKMVLEVEFFEEVGTGTGPTLEFFFLLSKQFRRRKQHMWLDTGVASQDDLVVAPHGLFPAPITPPRMNGKTHASRLKSFNLLGKVIGKTLQDGRMLDLPLAPAFYRMLLGQSLGLHDIHGLDPALGNTLRRLDAAANEIEKMKREGASESEWSQITIDGAKVEDLCLTFVIPGVDSMELIKGGSDVAVTAVNLREYVDAVIDACVGSGVATYFESVRAGLEEVFPLARLKMFSESELDAVICGEGERWTPEMLAECITFDHGYNAQSPPVKNFCEILSGFNSDQQRAFMRFVTGAPRLPPGGLAALQPRLTVVCKQPSSAVGLAADSPPVAVGTPLADGDLPSAMTCASYLKLPPYSCKEIMSERLIYAMTEGQGSFDLS